MREPGRAGSGPGRPDGGSRARQDPRGKARARAGGRRSGEPQTRSPTPETPRPAGKSRKGGMPTGRCVARKDPPASRYMPTIRPLPGPQPPPFDAPRDRAPPVPHPFPPPPSTALPLEPPLKSTRRTLRSPWRPCQHELTRVCLPAQGQMGARPPSVGSHARFCRSAGTRTRPCRCDIAPFLTGPHPATPGQLRGRTHNAQTCQREILPI